MSGVAALLVWVSTFILICNNMSLHLNSFIPFYVLNIHELAFVSATFQYNLCVP